ncbi:MAG: cytochrome c [candidate division KSB1 bacterium]|nr:cytochrome c [candidate division KSB1 bacterium]
MWLYPLLLTLALWAMAPGAVLAQQEDIIAVGHREFRQFCAVCHGLGGTGESVMTTLNLLTVRPADLTQLSKKHQGQFPFWHVYRIIDGRQEVRGHGTRDMPIWGDVFRQPEEGRPVDDIRAIGRILVLVYYLESIQEK